MTPQEWRIMCGRIYWDDGEKQDVSMQQLISRGELTARKIAKWRERHERTHEEGR